MIFTEKVDAKLIRPTTERLKDDVRLVELLMLYPSSFIL